MGPFTVEKVLSLQVQIYPVFHVSLIEPYATKTIPEHVDLLPASVDISNQEDYIVEYNFYSKCFSKTLKFCIQEKSFKLNNNV
jgi:hypothetical protein